MFGRVFIAVILSQFGLLQACAANHEIVSNTLLCHAEAENKSANLLEVAAGFCEAIRLSLEDQLGAPLQMVGAHEAEWTIHVLIDTARADAVVAYGPSGLEDDLRFDIMDASIDPVTLRPFAADVAHMALRMKKNSGLSSD